MVERGGAGRVALLGAASPPRWGAMGDGLLKSGTHTFAMYSGSFSALSPARGKGGKEAELYSNLLVIVPMPSITMLTLLPGVIAPTPTELPQAITSPASSVMSWEIRLTSFSGGKTMSESG